jgi:hypothetical protein
MIESIYKGNMERKLVLKDEFLSILNSMLLKYKECENCHFVDILLLDEVDEEGCNWMGANVELICGGETSEKCRPFVSKVLSEAGEIYNIKK